MQKTPLQISYFSDVLCIWAYIAQIRLEELKIKFGQNILITPYHVTLFGDTQTRIAEGWKERGGYAGFNEHVLSVTEKFTHIEVNPNIWKTCQPKTSGNAHLFLKAIQCLELSRNKNSSLVDEPHSLLKEVEWAVRMAFFNDARDISQISVLYDIAKQASIDKNEIEPFFNDGSAMALFTAEMLMKESHKLDGSPTYIFNENRQKLFGNVGYNILQANVAEILSTEQSSSASWC